MTMKNVILQAVSILALCSLGWQSATAFEAPSDLRIVETDLGPVMTDSEGLTLYIFDNDTKDKSNCYGKCEKLWPIYLAPEDAQPIGDFKPIDRDDGYKQWSYKGRPLYTWVKDKAEGDVTGQGFRGTWYVATLDGEIVKTNAGGSSGAGYGNGSYER